MQLKIINTENKETGKISLPAQFAEPVRADIISRAVLALQSHRRTPYGADPRAGKKAAATLSKRRRDYKGVYGRGMSRTPRKTMSRNGTQMNQVGAFAPMTVGGRRAFPPIAEKVWFQKINDKERRKAIRSAIAAAMLNSLVAQRGHSVPSSYPFALSKDFENLAKTKEFVAALNAIGLSAELERSAIVKVRAGQGKSRGRKYKRRKGPLVVVAGECKALKAAEGIPGVDIVQVKHLNAELLAPGTHIGRLTLFTENAIKMIEAEKLFS
jgi:large subunit ribosomal protein L4e